MEIGGRGGENVYFGEERKGICKGSTVGMEK